MRDLHGTAVRARRRRLRPHPFEELRDSEELCRHLVADHDYETDGPWSWTGVRLLHTTTDATVGLAWGHARDQRYDAVYRARGARDLEDLRLEHLVDDHMRDHD